MKLAARWVENCDAYSRRTVRLLTLTQARTPILAAISAI